MKQNVNDSKINNNIFTKIVKGEVPCYKIYEDKHTLAFLDIAKDITGHTLVIPKTYSSNIFECDTFTLNRVIKTVKKVSEHYVNNCGYEGVNILNANNSVAGQSVDYLHFHIIPRHSSDKQNAWPKLNYYIEDISTTHKKLTLIK